MKKAKDFFFQVTGKKFYALHFTPLKGSTTFCVAFFYVAMKVLAFSEWNRAKEGLKDNKASSNISDRVKEKKKEFSPRKFPSLIIEGERTKIGRETYSLNFD